MIIQPDAELQDLNEAIDDYDAIVEQLETAAEDGADLSDIDKKAMQTYGDVADKLTELADFIEEQSDAPETEPPTEPQP